MEAMKTLIINGSPKPKGDTTALINAFTEKLSGELIVLSCFNHISPCVDCRHCWQNPGCVIDDEMQAIYEYLNQCDNVVLASPIWFSSLSGPLLNIASRIQTLFAAAYFRREKNTMKVKNGVIILAGAETGTEVIPAQTAAAIMKFMNVKRPIAAHVYSLDTNRIPAAEDSRALADAENAALLLNQLYREAQR